MSEASDLRPSLKVLEEETKRIRLENELALAKELQATLARGLVAAPDERSVSSGMWGEVRKLALPALAMTVFTIAALCATIYFVNLTVKLMAA